MAGRKRSRTREARAHPRARARIRVEYHFGNTTGVGFTKDISEGGMFLECDRVAQRGARIYLRVYLPDRDVTDPLKVIGTVTRAARPPAGMVRPSEPPIPGADATGMGVRFEAAYARTREALTAFVDELLAKSGPASTPSPIEQAPGSTDRRREFTVRFPAHDVVGTGVVGTSQRRSSRPPPRRSRPPPMNVDEVRKAFSFETAVDWGRFLSIAVRVAIALIIILVVYYFIRWIIGMLSGSLG